MLCLATPGPGSGRVPLRPHTVVGCESFLLAEASLEEVGHQEPARSQVCRSGVQWDDRSRAQGEAAGRGALGPVLPAEARPPLCPSRLLLCRAPLLRTPRAGQPAFLESHARAVAASPPLQGRNTLRAVA